MPFWALDWAGAFRQWRKKVDESFKEQGLTDASRMPLLMLYTHGEAMLQKDLAQALSLDTSSLVRVLDQLRDGELGAVGLRTCRPAHQMHCPDP